MTKLQRVIKIYGDFSQAVEVRPVEKQGNRVSPVDQAFRLTGITVGTSQAYKHGSVQYVFTNTAGNEQLVAAAKTLKDGMILDGRSGNTINIYPNGDVTVCTEKLEAAPA
jgi:hypothetical protein